MRAFFAFLINSNLYIAVAALLWWYAGFAWISPKFANPFSFGRDAKLLSEVALLSSVVFWATLLVYNIDVLLPESTQKTAGLSSGQRWRLKHYRLNLILVILAIIALFSMLFWLSLPVLLAFLGLGFLCLLYYLPYFPGLSIGLRHVPYTKIFLISTVWAAIGSIIPALLLAANPLLVLPNFGMKFLFIFGLCLPFDLKDQHIDQMQLLKTIPQKLSQTKTLLLVLFTHLLFLFTGFVLCEFSLPPFLYLSFAYVVVLCFSHHYLLKRPLLYTLAWDGGIYIYSLLLLIEQLAVVIATKN